MIKWYQWEDEWFKNISSEGLIIPKNKLTNNTKHHSKKKSSDDFLRCKQCNYPYKFAEPNQEDGTLICYKCRHNL